MQLLGIHHLTAISARIRDNYRFYTQTLGMRLVKRSVNQDDVSAYHLFYADNVGSPGSDLTFFDFPVLPERRGTRSCKRGGRGARRHVPPMIGRETDAAEADASIGSSLSGSRRD
jgi:catechol 2,3-dioxygenase-like lactoylglutathione lyase family enzyme